MLKEECRWKGLGEDIGRVVLRGNAEKDDGEAEDRPPDHGVPGRHPAGTLVDTLTDGTDLYGPRVSEQRFGSGLLEAAVHILEESAEAEDVLVCDHHHAQLH